MPTFDPNYIIICNTKEESIGHTCMCVCWQLMRRNSHTADEDNGGQLPREGEGQGTTKETPSPLIRFIGSEDPTCPPLPSLAQRIQCSLPLITVTGSTFSPPPN